MRRRSPERTAEQIIGSIAESQYGLVTRTQLKRAGLSEESVDRRLKKGLLRSIHRGVFTVGTPLLLPGARELAAVLACQPRAYASHRSAAHLLDLLPLPKNSATVEVSVEGRDVRRGSIRVHRVGTFGPGEIGEVDDIPVTSPARTILDLSGRLDDEELEHVVAEAHAQSRTITAQLVNLLTLHRYRRGIAPLRALIESHQEPQRTRSKAERRLLRLIRERGLPEPQANAVVAGYEVDLYWAEHGLIVEFDSFRFHSSRRAFERDRRRDQALAALGHTVMRVTWLQLTRTPEQVVERIAEALSRRSALALG
jgi:very-short-patch-repair endonuclease